MLKIKTQSGSTYLIDVENMTWERTEHAPESKYVRTGGGKLWSMPHIQKEHPMVLLGPPIDGDMDIRVITTTPVVEIDHI